MSRHSRIGASPYEITYGKKPLTIPQYVTGTSKVTAMDDFLTNREVVFALYRKKLLKAREVMKTSTDTKRRDMNFQCGDWVMVKLRPHMQSSVSNTTHSKLAKRFYGPYQIVEQIGKVAYKLNLPAGSRIHPVFHCSILKPFKQTSTCIPLPLPAKAVDSKPLISPLTIVSTKWDQKSSSPKLLVLVQWEGLSLDDATWEDWEELKSDFNLEDKVIFDVVGDEIQSKIHKWKWQVDPRGKYQHQNI